MIETVADSYDVYIMCYLHPVLPGIVVAYWLKLKLSKGLPRVRV